MKKVILLAAFVLLGNSFVSCDNDKVHAGNDVSFNTDDGIIPPKPPKPPFPPLANSASDKS